MKVSEALGVSSSKLWKQGVFDSYIGVDSRLHIDPALLRTTRVPELRGSLDRFNKYFSGVFALVVAAEKGGQLERQAIQRLTFPEIPIAALGFSRTSTSGRGVSPALAKRLYVTAKEVAEAGIKDPAIFELAVIFEDKFGPDLISDMTLRVILDDVVQFNLRVCQTLKIPVASAMVKGVGMIRCAHSQVTGENILLIPKGLLSELPEATCRDEIDHVVMYNSKIRETLNKMLGDSWSNLTKKLSKTDLKRIFIENPTALRALLSKYKAARPQPYDFNADPCGEIIWEKLGAEAAQKNPLSLAAPLSQQELNNVVSTIAKHFKKMVESNGHAHLLFDDNGGARHEKFSQLLFFAIADSFCRANKLELSREPNAGRGPVDFKLSNGNGRALVELKLSSNSKALDGLLAQLPEYAKAEGSPFNLFVLLLVGPAQTRVNRIKATHRKLRKQGQRVPELLIIDAFGAYNSPSASELSWD